MIGFCVGGLGGALLPPSLVITLMLGRTPGFNPGLIGGLGKVEGRLPVS